MLSNIKITQKSLNSVKCVNVITTKGDSISYENLKESMKNNGVLEPIFIDTNDTVKCLTKINDIKVGLKIAI